MMRLLNYTYIYLIPLLLSAIFSLKSFWLKWPKQYRLFSYILWSTVIIESFAIAWKWYFFQTEYWTYSKSNLWIYNAYLMIRVLLFLLFFSQVLLPGLFKRIILLFAWIVIPFGIINYFFIQGPHTVNTYTIIPSNIIILVLSISFFQQVLKEKKIIRLSADPLTWISLGAFIYYSGTLPFFISFNYLIKEHLPMALSYLYINDALNIVMYSLYLIAFLCKPQLK